MIETAQIPMVWLGEMIRSRCSNRLIWPHRMGSWVDNHRTSNTGGHLAVATARVRSRRTFRTRKYGAYSIAAGGRGNRTVRLSDGSPRNITLPNRGGARPDGVRSGVDEQRGGGSRPSRDRWIVIDGGGDESPLDQEHEL